VADLVIPIPNSINQQGLQQNLQVYGQFLQANPQNFAAIGGFGFPGQFPVANPFVQNLGAPPRQFQQGLNPFQLQGGLPGNNQFGNLGGQFGLQGQDYSKQLLQLITRVVAPREWDKLPPDSQPLGMPPPGLNVAPEIAGVTDPVYPQE